VPGNKYLVTFRFVVDTKLSKVILSMARYLFRATATHKAFPHLNYRLFER